MKNLLLINLLVFAFLISCEKDEIKEYGNLEGTIQNEYGQPIEGAYVELGNLSDSSGVFGLYSFEKLNIKEYTITVSKENFLPETHEVSIQPNKTEILDFILFAGEAFINISDSVKNVNPYGGAFNVEVSSNAAWTVESNSQWISYSSDHGEGNGIIQVGYQRNESSSSREDTVIFKSGSIEKQLVIHQVGAVKVVSYQGIIGNGEDGAKDSVFVLFNKPINVESITSNWIYCISDINYTLTDNNCGLRFSYSCADLGGSYPFTISVSDNDGYEITETINVPFYKSKLDFEGLMTDYLFINNDKEVLISAFLPSRLIRYSIEQDSILQTIDLSADLSPIVLSLNPYNSKVYMMGSDPDAQWRDTYVDRPDIYTYDLQTNVVTKAITIQPDGNDHPQYPTNIPFKLAFTNTGVGVVLLKSNESSDYRWKIIDCTNGHSVYIYPYYNSIIDDGIDFLGVHRNHDNTKLYLRQYASCAYGIFDGATDHITLVTPSSITRSKFITPNRKSDKFFAGQLYDQFVIDLEGNMSQISTIDNRNNGSADFSYRTTDDNVVYFCDNDYLRVMDYNTGSTPMWCDVIYGLKKLRTTIDGEQTVAYKQNSDISSSFYVFDTKYFHR